MTQVIVDAALRMKFPDLSKPLELCDESGNVLARVIPVQDLPHFEAWEPVFGEEDLVRQEQANEKRYNTQEVLNHLEKL